MACDFIAQLSKLRKSSAESVENTKGFDQFKVYLHIERQVEAELRDLLKKVQRNQKKCLLLLCGSAGDGKSHLISYMKNCDQENLLSDYELYNDATESSEPTLTSNDTLAMKLRPFNDEHLQDDDEKKMIIAINLGTLNNFIDSEQGKQFSCLRKYVNDHGILSSYAQNIGYCANSVFQHVSFADYQVFSLCSEGLKTDFLEQLLHKVFSADDSNPFYKAYREDFACPMHERCPVRHNFELLSNEQIQKAVISRIVQAVVIEKTIVSTRDVLNLLYDLIVHPDFNPEHISPSASPIQFLSDYISWSTPMLMNEYADISPLINAMRNYDVLSCRTEDSDADVIRFHSLENIESFFERATEDTPYAVLGEITNIYEHGGKKPELKKLVYKFIARLQSMTGATKKNEHQSRFETYLGYLYNQNAGKEKKLVPLYKDTKSAVLNWNGDFGQDYICVDDSNNYYWLIEELKLTWVFNRRTHEIDGDVQRFSPVINVGFRKDSEDRNPISIKVDFSLYELIINMKEGYRPTAHDKNRHTDFVSFIRQLIELGDKSKRVILVPKGGDNKPRMQFEEIDTDFFEFKVVR